MFDLCYANNIVGENVGGRTSVALISMALMLAALVSLAQNAFKGAGELISHKTHFKFRRVNAS
jgi:hypothetical protein